jgi:hypothetical protein
VDDRNEFIERLKSKEVANRDQVDAESERKQQQQLAEQKILATAPNEFKRMPKIAGDRVEAANTKLDSKFSVLSIAGGFAIRLGRDSAGFVYSQTFANAGPIALSVYIQRQPTNLEAFGITQPERRTVGPLEWNLEPAWDVQSDSLRWRHARGQGFTSEALIEKAMSTLMDRSRS